MLLLLLLVGCMLLLQLQCCLLYLQHALCRLRQRKQRKLQL